MTGDRPAGKKNKEKNNRGAASTKTWKRRCGVRGRRGGEEERERQETRNGYRGGGYAMRDSPGWKSVRARAHTRFSRRGKSWERRAP